MDKLDFRGLDGIVKKLQKLVDFAAAHAYEKINLDTVNIYTEGPFLHQNIVKDGLVVKTESKSAEEERQNPKLFAKRRELMEQLRGIIG